MGKMVNPELEVVRFENEDVIATSVTLTRRADGKWVFEGQVYDNADSFDGWSANVQQPDGYYANNPSGAEGQLQAGKEYNWVYSDGVYWLQQQ